MMTEKAAAIRALLTRAWRERWSDVQWSINLKTILPSSGGNNTDGHNCLAVIILDQALVSPIPNSMILSYLTHSLCARTITHASVLEAVVSGPRGDLQYLKRRPHCVAALLDFLELCQRLIASRGKPEECIVLTTALMNTTLWLLKYVSAVLESIVANPNPPQQSSTQAKLSKDNSKRALKLLVTIVENNFAYNLLYVGKAEDKDLYNKVYAAAKQLDQVVNGGSSSKGSSNNSNNVNTNSAALQDYKADASVVVSSLKTIDPLKSLSIQSAAHELPSFVHAVQPMLMYEALLRPSSDLSTLSHHLTTVGQMLGNVSFIDLVYEVIRSLLLSIPHKEGLEPLKIDAFILVRLPYLLEKLFRLSKGSESAASAPLKTPTDLYKVFDKLLKNDALLDSTDLRCQCNIVKILLEIIGKSSTPLMTDTERDDVLKKRQNKIKESKIPLHLIPDDIVGNTRNFELTLRAEEKLESVLKSFENSDKPDSAEHLLGLFQNILKSDFDMWQALASTTGNLEALVKILVKTNHLNQESQGESVKNSLNRAALFDLTFLMLVYIVQSFGSDIVLANADPGSFIAKWIKGFMVETDGRVKSFNNNLIPDNNVDTLLQQLSNGELRTQVVKWQNVCVSIHLAMNEMMVARAKNCLKEDVYKKMIRSLCSKLCALPVCVVAWLASHQNFMPSDAIDVSKMAVEFAEIAEEVANSQLQNQQQQQQSQPPPPNGGQGGPGADVPYIKERCSLMSAILEKILIHTGLTGSKKKGSNLIVVDPKMASMVLKPAQVCKPLEVALLEEWQGIVKRGWLDVEAAWWIRYFLKAGGPNWFVGVLVKDLLCAIYQDDINKRTELMRAMFHVDIEQTTLALLLNVVPTYLQHKDMREKLTDPHGSALVKLLVGCLYTLVVSAAKNLDVVGKKRRASELIDEVPSAKMRRLVDLNSLDESKTKTEKESSSSSSSSTASNPHAVTSALSGFFRLLHTVVCCQDYQQVTPCTYFAFRLLEQTALRSSKGSSSYAKSKLIFQHMPLSLIMHLVKVLPEQFSMGIVAKIFDLSSSSGRKNTARIMCLLRNVKNSIDSNEPRPTATQG